MLLIIWAGYRCARGLIQQSSESVGDMFEMREETLDLATVVSQVRGLSRLETASMEIIQVLQVSQSHDVIPDVVAGDRVRLMAVGFGCLYAVGFGGSAHHGSRLRWGRKA